MSGWNFCPLAVRGRFGAGWNSMNRIQNYCLQVEFFYSAFKMFQWIALGTPTSISLKVRYFRKLIPSIKFLHRNTWICVIEHLGVVIQPKWHIKKPSHLSIAFFLLSQFYNLNSSFIWLINTSVFQCKVTYNVSVIHMDVPLFC